MLLEKKNVSEVQKWRSEFGTLPRCVPVSWLNGKLGSDGTVQNVGKEHSEDLAFQLTVEVLRQCYRSTQSSRMLYGNAFVGLDTEPVFVAFFRVRRLIG
jgi:hypothetical protein